MAKIKINQFSKVNYEYILYYIKFSVFNKSNIFLQQKLKAEINLLNIYRIKESDWSFLAAGY